MKILSKNKSLFLLGFFAIILIDNWSIAQLYPPDYINLDRTEDQLLKCMQNLDNDSFIKWKYPLFPDLLYEFNRARFNNFFKNNYKVKMNNKNRFYKSASHRKSAGNSAKIQDFGFELAWVNGFEDDRQSNEDYIVDVVLDSSGIIYVTGASSNLDHGVDFYTIKYDSAGNELWARRFDSGGDDVPVVLGLDNSNNIYVFGQTDGLSNSVDLLLLKYTTDGELQWQYSYDNPENSDSYAMGCVVMANGTAYLAGTQYLPSPSSFVLIAVDSTGGQFWLDSTIPITQAFYATQITCDQLYNVFLSGGKQEDGNELIATYKYDQWGNREWEKLYPLEAAIVREVCVDDSGYIYVAGPVWGAYPNYPTVTSILVKYDQNGDEQWVKTFDYMGQGGRDNDLMIDKESNVYLIGSDGLVKCDSKGTLIWNIDISGYKVFKKNDGNLIAVNSQFGIVLINDDGIVQRTVPLSNPPGDYRNIGDSELSIFDKLIMAGSMSTLPTHNSSFFLVQSDAQGNELFRRQYSGPGAHKSYARDLQLTPHGDIFVLGNTIDEPVIIGYLSDGSGRFSIIDQKFSEEIEADALCTNLDGSFYVVGRRGLARMTSGGACLWTRTYDKPGRSYYLYAQIDPMGGIIEAVSHTKSFDLYHYDDSGLLLWKQTNQYTAHLRPNVDYFEFYLTDMEVDANGYVYLYGINRISANNYRTFNEEVFLLKYSVSGNPEWMYTLDESNFGWPYDMDVDSEGNVYILGVAGGSSYWNVPASYTIQKIDLESKVNWSYEDRDVPHTYNWSGYIKVDQQNNSFIIISRYSVSNSISDLKITKFTPWGVPEWTEVYEENNSVWSNQLIIDQNGKIYILGNVSDYLGTKDAGLLLKYSSSGTNEAIMHYMSSAYYHDFFAGEVDPWGNVYIANTSNGSYGTRQMQLFKYQPAHPALDGHFFSEEMTLDQNAPNPFNDRTSIGFNLPQNGPVNLEIFDIRGQRILSENLGNLDSGAHIHEFSARGLASGIYYYRIRQQKYSITRKMVLLK